MIRRDSKLMDGGLGATPGTICGLDYMRDPKLNKGSSFTIEERQTLGIHGLLPPRVKSQEEQAGHSMRNLRRLSDPLNQYMYMVSDCLVDFPSFCLVTLPHFQFSIPNILNDLS